MYEGDTSSPPVATTVTRYFDFQRHVIRAELPRTWVKVQVVRLSAVFVVVETSSPALKISSFQPSSVAPSSGVSTVVSGIVQVTSSPSVRFVRRP